MTDAERHRVRAETMEELANSFERNPAKLVYDGMFQRNAWAELAEALRSKATDERRCMRQIERRNQIAVQHVATQMASI